MKEGKVNLDLDILKHQPQGIYESGLLRSIRAAAVVKALTREHAASYQNRHEALSFPVQVSKGLSHFLVV